MLYETMKFWYVLKVESPSPARAESSAIGNAIAAFEGGPSESPQPADFARCFFLGGFPHTEW